ncbi:hypothetical protein AVEN_270300-1 [Araneus ventricosus]|uniref:Uncharacterized protein n=1 Tax=Araneus ventricosus TaxID=182803 RepID=A0A4Y2U2T5_ARAVE|nr:hypothetical protein AVEN_270300-1 [Araneus ventricosus]
MRKVNNLSPETNLVTMAQSADNKILVDDKNLTDVKALQKSRRGGRALSSLDQELTRAIEATIARASSSSSSKQEETLQASPFTSSSLTVVTREPLISSSPLTTQDLAVNDTIKSTTVLAQPPSCIKFPTSSHPIVLSRTPSPTICVSPISLENSQGNSNTQAFNISIPEIQDC